MKYFLFLCLTFSGSLFSQDTFNFNNFSVSEVDLSTNVFVKDSSANALVIHEFGKSYVDEKTLDLTFEFKQKLKILNQSGVDNANISIYLYKDGRTKERVKDVVASSYNLVNGELQQTKLSDENIIEEDYNTNLNIVKLVFPNVKAGTVINYSYTKTSPFMFKYQPWSFQSDIPKLYSEYNTSIPANYDYNIKLVGSQPLDVKESKLSNRCLILNSGSADCTESIYIMKNIPAFIDEKFMTTRDNYLSRIEYELKTFRGFDGGVKNYTKTWDIVDRELKTESGIGRQLNKGKHVRDLLSQDIINEKNKLEKAKAILNFVKTNFTWNEKYNLFKETTIKDLINEGSGNANQINLLLYNLLEENSIEVSTIILSTRNNGLPTKIYPVLTDFNYILIKATINGESYLLDATDKYLAFGQIPFSTLNQYGRILDFKNGSTWIDIEPKGTSIQYYKTILDITKEETLQGSVESTFKGYPALSQKKKYFSNKSNYIKSVQDAYVNLKISNHIVTTTEFSSDSYNENFEVELAPEKIGDLTYVNPFLLTFFDENPFKLQERTYPIDFGYKDVYQHSIKINLNNLYEVVELPKDVTKQLPNNTGQLVFNVKQEDDAILLYFKYDFKEAIYNSQYYKYLKYYLGVVLDIEKNTLIVLKEKAPNKIIEKK